MEKLKEWLTVIIQAIVIVFILFVFCWPVTVRGISMQNTLYTGDRVFMSRFLSWNNKIYPGDLITFSIVYVDKTGKHIEKELIKRVVAKAGDKVDIKDGKIFINDEFLEETYALGIIFEDMEIIVPKDSYYVLGDNREHSTDSRTLGTISKKQVTGKVIAKWFPFSEAVIY